MGAGITFIRKVSSFQIGYFSCLKKKVYDQCVFSVLTYVAETLTFKLKYVIKSK